MAENREADRSPRKLRADLHVHSLHSSHTSSFGIGRFFTPTSQASAREIYQTAKRRGMDLVTITDRHTIDGSLALVELYPREAFIGLEVDAVFPEDGCKVSVLIYGITEKQFHKIGRARHDIYELVLYMQKRRIPHVVSHPTRSVNGRLTSAHIEKLALLFKVFEGINGSQARVHNSTLVRSLKELSPAKIEEYSDRHGIEPIGERPWKKSFTGGSNDYANLMGGTTCTVAAADDVDSFLQAIQSGNVEPEGRDSDFRSATFSAYKLAYDQIRGLTSLSGSNPLGATDPTALVVRQLGKWIFESEGLSLLDKIKLQTLAATSRLRSDRAAEIAVELATECAKVDGADVTKRIDIAFERLSDLIDEIIRSFLDGMVPAVEKGRVLRYLKESQTPLSNMVLLLPVFGALRNLYRDQDMLREMRSSFSSEPGGAAEDGSEDRSGGAKQPRGDSKGKKILWFSDTLEDLNGPSVTLRQIGKLSHERGLRIEIVGAFGSDVPAEDLPESFTNLPTVGEFVLPYYSAYTMRIPSILRSLERLVDFQPDEIYVSTPGPVGLLGLLAAHLLRVRSVGIYHTDFLQQAADIVPHDTVLHALEDFIQLFYSLFDEVAVPTSEYVNILASRGYDTTKMRVFQRGIDAQLFKPRSRGRQYLSHRFGIPEGPRLLYVGRISREKRLDFLVEAFQRVRKRHPDASLILTGSGPILQELEERDHPGVFLIGRQDLRALPNIYSGSDLFVFPSLTDTFGMAVLEAQACGLPAVVSDVGGPKELVIDEKTGWIVRQQEVEPWAKALNRILDQLAADPNSFMEIREAARERVLKDHDWETVLAKYVEGVTLSPDEGAPSEVTP